MPCGRAGRFRVPQVDLEGGKDGRAASGEGILYSEHSTTRGYGEGIGASRLAGACCRRTLALEAASA